MNKFARWSGYTLERIACHIEKGRLEFRAEMTAELHRAEVLSVVRSDPEKNYIPAIKLHRQHFGSTLKEAKDAVDEMRKQIGYVAPAPWYAQR